MQNPYLEENLFEAIVVNKNKQRVSCQPTYRFLDSTLKKRFFLISNNFNQEYCVHDKEELLVINTKIGRELLFKKKKETKKYKNTIFLENNLKRINFLNRKDYVLVKRTKLVEKENLNYPNKKRKKEKREILVNKYDTFKRSEYIFVMNKHTGFLKSCKVNNAKMAELNLVKYLTFHRNLVEYFLTKNKSEEINLLYFLIFEYFKTLLYNRLNDRLNNTSIYNLKEKKGVKVITEKLSKFEEHHLKANRKLFKIDRKSFKIDEKKLAEALKIRRALPQREEKLKEYEKNAHNHFKNNKKKYLTKKQKYRHRQRIKNYVKERVERLEMKEIAEEKNKMKLQWILKEKKRLELEKIKEIKRIEKEKRREEEIKMMKKMMEEIRKKLNEELKEKDTSKINYSYLKLEPNKDILQLKINSSKIFIYLNNLKNYRFNNSELLQSTIKYKRLKKKISKKQIYDNSLLSFKKISLYNEKKFLSYEWFNFFNKIKIHEYYLKNGSFETSAKKGVENHTLRSFKLLKKEENLFTISSKKLIDSNIISKSLTGEIDPVISSTPPLRRWKIGYYKDPSKRVEVVSKMKKKFKKIKKKIIKRKKKNN